MDNKKHIILQIVLLAQLTWSGKVFFDHWSLEIYDWKFYTSLSGFLIFIFFEITLINSRVKNK